MLTGPDISHHQGVVGFAQVRTRHQVVIMKATEGTGFVDRRFHVNMVGARNVGLRVGAYHFLRRESNGAVQADHFLSTVGTGPGVVYVVDCETSASHTNPTIDTIRDFCARVIQRTGREPVLYTYNSWWSANVGPVVPVPCHYLWVARYRDKNLGYGKVPPVPAVFGWQWTSQGSCPGVAGDCDLNDFYVSEAQWDAAAGSRPTPIPTPTPVEDDPLAAYTKDELDQKFEDVAKQAGLYAVAGILTQLKDPESDLSKALIAYMAAGTNRAHHYNPDDPEYDTKTRTVRRLEKVVTDVLAGGVQPEG